MSVDDVTVNESDMSATFTLTLSAASDQVVSVRFQTVDGTATAGSDYSANDVWVEFSPGEVSTPVWVGIFWDSTTEPPQTFTGHIAMVDGAVIDRGDGTATILDSPRPPGAPGVIAFVKVST